MATLRRRALTYGVSRWSPRGPRPATGAWSATRGGDAGMLWHVTRALTQRASHRVAAVAVDPREGSRALGPTRRRGPYAGIRSHAGNMEPPDGAGQRALQQGQCTRSHEGRWHSPDVLPTFQGACLAEQHPRPPPKRRALRGAHGAAPPATVAAVRGYDAGCGCAGAAAAARVEPDTRVHAKGSGEGCAARIAHRDWLSEKILRAAGACRDHCWVRCIPPMQRCNIAAGAVQQHPCRRAFAPAPLHVLQCRSGDCWTVCSSP